MSVIVKALEGFPRTIFVRRKLNEADDKALGTLDNAAGAVVGDTSIVTDDFSVAESALVKKGMMFFAGNKAVCAADAISAISSQAVSITGLDATELAAIKTGDTLKVVTAATDYFYEIIKADSTFIYIQGGLEVATVAADVITVLNSDPYQVNEITEAAGLITGLSFAPALKTALVDDDDVVFGHGFVRVGSLTADSFADSQSSTTNEKKNEAGQIIGTNSVQDSRTLTLNLVENSEYNLMTWGKRLAFVNTGGTMTYTNPQETFIVGIENIFDVLIVKDDCAEQYYDLDYRLRYPVCQYTPESIEINPTAANVSQMWTPILRVIPSACGGDSNGEIIGNPLLA